LLAGLSQLGYLLIYYFIDSFSYIILALIKAEIIDLLPKLFKLSLFLFQLSFDYA
jgi:hypothetical protein